MASKDQLARPDFQAAAPDYIGMFCKKLPQLDPSKNLYEKFRDFCEMLYCAYAQRAPGCGPEKAASLEARYMDIVGTYRDKSAVRAYPELLAWAAVAITSGQEFFGAVASRLELLDTKQNSQFFTPHDISKMLAQMVVQDPGPLIEENGFITVSEPASGAGGMILAVADVLQARGYDPAQHMLVHATDVSPLCYHMTYVQLTLRGIPAAVIRANTLTMEQFESAWTPPTGLFFEKHGRLFDAPRQQPADFKVDARGQLGLF